MSGKIPVAVLGATGTVGQRMIQLLADHPQFEVTAVAASDRSQGKTFGEACTWRLGGDMPSFVRSMPVQPPSPPLDCDMVFSSLPGDIARETEGSFAAAGYPVISNSSAFRMDENVPLLIPEVNHEHLALIAKQKQHYSTGGFIVTNHYDMLPEFMRDMATWAAAGKMKWRETIYDGIERAPEAFIGLFKGENFGKMLVRVGPDKAV